MELHMKRFFVALSTVVLALAFTGCATKTAASTTAPAANTSGSPPATSSSIPPVSVPPGSVSGIESAVEAVYANTNRSVVNIQVTLAPSITNPGGGALGSGWVWDTDGHIVTNNHVVDGATSMTVTFYDGSTVDATVTGTDSDSDLAVIKVNPADVTANGIQLQPVTVGDSSQLKVGQLVIAIGNPFGLQGTMTVGFISGLGRLLPASQNAVGPSYSIPDIIQTDAAINPGNSGGVLLNDNGQVIGVPSSIATTSGANEGVGFAIPSGIVKQVVPALIKSGRYDHPYFGISLTSLTPDLAKAMNLPATQRGALVESVTAGSPADKAGIKASQKQTTINGQQVGVGGDVIIAYNGQTVKTSDDLIALLARSGVVGQTATLTVLRGGQQVQVQVTLGARPTS
jgi:S1-C subfamily serine protease